MNYIEMFKALSDSAILFVGSAAIIGAGALAFGAFVWLYLWLGKHLVKYVHKVGAEFKECLTAPGTGKRVKANG